jgi:pimeloyl-ACP methyl ester carboxylesterase
MGRVEQLWWRGPTAKKEQKDDGTAMSSAMKFFFAVIKSLRRSLLGFSIVQVRESVRCSCASPFQACAHRVISSGFCAAITLFWLGSSVDADEFVNLVIPLKDGRYYSLHDFCRESNRRLKTAYDVNRIPDRQLELTEQEKTLLRLAASVDGTDGLLKVRFEPDRLILSLPDRENDSVRRRNRHRLERLLGLQLDTWSSGKGLHIPSKFDPQRQSVLLIHGLESDAAAMTGWRTGLEGRGFQVLIFDYPNDGPLEWSGDRLSIDLKKLAAANAGFRVAIVAHSMGGLVSRYCLETPGKNPGCVTDLFLLGTPNQGSWLADGQEWLELVLETLPNRLGRWDSIRDGLGEAADDLRPGSLFLTQLNKQLPPPDVRYRVAIGNRGFMTEDQAVRVMTELESALTRRGVSATRRAEILGKLGQVEELQHGRGDGAVSVKSARLKGAGVEKIFDVNHLQFLPIPAADPASNEVFRWIVDFLQPDRK